MALNWNEQVSIGERLHIKTQMNILQMLFLILFVFSFAKALIGPRFFCARCHLTLVYRGGVPLSYM